MDCYKRFFLSTGCLRAGVLALATLAVPSSNAATVWTGPNITWTKSAATPTDVIIPGAVELSRGSTRWLYNVAAGESSPGNSSPTDTMWAMGDISNFSTLNYKTFASFRNGNLAGVILGKPMVVHLVNEDIYFSVKFTAWGAHGAGTVAYTRSTAAVVVAPTVSITTPSEGAVFSAPASIQLTANASVSGGTVTNVEYFAGTTSLGSATTAPFAVTGSIPAAGSYALTAVATAGGVSATSAVVNITVNAVSTPTVTITAPADGAIFLTPADVTISADATVGGSTVTNVSFFNQTTLLGSVQIAPFSLTVSNLAAGTYSLSAVATASGVSATSGVVNITVVSPVAFSLTSPTVSNGFFSFSYAADPGLTYVVQRASSVTSSNVFDWASVVTNVASTNLVLFSEALATNLSHFYRVGRLPNP